MAKVDIGDAAPDFELEGTEGAFKLSEHRGERVVLLFYPGDEEGIIRHRHVHALGLDFQATDELREALDKLGSPA
jgi:hypothetical protein